jgi:hypothetical protein
MTSHERAGRTLGALLLLHLATGLIVPYILLIPLQAGFLDNAAGMPGLVRLSVLLLFVGGAASVLISMALWPGAREHSPRLGLGLLALAVVNFTLQLIENSHWLTLLSVSQAYAAAGAAEAASFERLGVVVQAAAKWAHYSHILVVVGWLFALYALLLRGAMIPRVLASIGLAACVLHFIGITLPAFGGYRMPLPELFGMPLGLINLVVAGWLMARGINEQRQREASSAATS